MDLGFRGLGVWGLGREFEDVGVQGFVIGLASGFERYGFESDLGRGCEVGFCSSSTGMYTSYDL